MINILVNNKININNNKDKYLGYSYESKEN